MTKQSSQQEKEESDADFFTQYADYAPAVIDFINKNPDNVFAKVLAAVAGFFFKEGAVDFPPVAEEMKPLLAERASKQIDPLHAAKLYTDAFMTGEPPQTLTIHYAGSNQPVPLTLQKSVNDSETGFRGAIYRDANGHAITLFGGMDILHGVDMKDLEAMAQARLMKQGVNQQTGPAQELYLEAVRTSGSAEIVGYSLGAMLANDTAARLGAKATTIADIGLPDVKDTNGKSMYTATHIKNIHDNVTVVKIVNDLYFEKAGKVHGGTVVELNAVSGNEIHKAIGETGLTVNFNAQSMIAHHPLAYTLASDHMQPHEQAAAVTAPVAGAKAGS
ncbi:MAG TPA: hypothetical protein PKX38_05205 [Alphaproteobacteria bacterium]|nr:hypothetical protein [Micavibrio sp.]MBK9562976.1 hypothetical protein [Micavibrio sp.]HQX27319.1 hypothetical protein [Alphaproteobacteria bacterium]